MWILIIVCIIKIDIQLIAIINERTVNSVVIVKGEAVKTNHLGGGVSRKILAAGGKLMAVEVSFEKGAVGASHTHPHEQISYVLKGSFEFHSEGKKEIIKAGDSYYTTPNQPHGVTALEDGILLDIFTPQREDFLK